MNRLIMKKIGMGISMKIRRVNLKSDEVLEIVVDYQVRLRVMESELDQYNETSLLLEMTDFGYDWGDRAKNEIRDKIKDI